jgi:hypothetical protein
MIAAWPSKTVFLEIFLKTTKMKINNFGTFDRVIFKKNIFWG